MMAVAGFQLGVLAQYLPRRTRSLKSYSDTWLFLLGACRSHVIIRVTLDKTFLISVRIHATVAYLSTTTISILDAMITTLPTELTSRILSIACLDATHNAHALRLTHPYLRAVVDEFGLEWNTLCLTSMKAISRFEALLLHEPHRVARARCRELFLGSPGRPTACFRGSNCCWDPSTCPWLTSVDGVARPHAIRAIRNILIFAAPHIEHLSLCFTSIHFDDIFPSLAMPRLQKMVLCMLSFPLHDALVNHTSLVTDEQCTYTPFPELQFLHLESLERPVNSSTSNIVTITPSLRRLSLGETRSQSFLTESSESDKTTLIPVSLESVVIQSGCLGHLMYSDHPIVVVRPRDDRRKGELDVAMKMWEARHAL